MIDWTPQISLTKGEGEREQQGEINCQEQSHVPNRLLQTYCQRSLIDPTCIARMKFELSEIGVTGVRLDSSGRVDRHPRADYFPFFLLPPTPPRL